ncbi:piezo-type mechanosensitive ion channel homolog isoform X1 [Prunus yedoensis var. nudiflora]|uniref:Piezo-type mechanosensitive ion channel homolog isoform X1 n=1 Tax=Prunus yedoensis var. nudiflora TaxID=2094558 RepID=A0A314UCB2_PRUYE|nr:piezo-type mechanosensitive ion channel homolog isoform X1 [Prunus yedoensis var. nudiflora]
MGRFLGGFVLPLLLLTAAFINWSLLSLVDLVAFLLILFNAPKIGFHFGRRLLLLWLIVIFSLFVIFSQVIYLVIWAIEGNKWIGAGAWWANLIGFMILHSWKSPSVLYFLLLQLSVVAVALVDLYGNRFGLVSSCDSCWGRFSSAVERLICSHLRVASCLLLPAIQLVVGISHPSWVSLPFFIGSCVGLVDWSLTSNFLGLFRWWKPFHLYAGFNIVLLYVYQLPVEFPDMLQWIADFIGLFKITLRSDWTEVCSSLSLLLFYIMLSCVKCDLEEMDFILSMKENNLTEQLLPSKHSFFIRESRSGVRHTNVLLTGAVFRTFSINFFTYGFPVSLFALSFWSFHFASVCAFGLLAYVGYIIYAFPSLFRLHRLNGLLLVFILLWAVSTYIFNVAFAFLNWKIGKNTDIWEMVGLWHYPIPGFFLLAQFCLGILVALGNLVNNSVFLCLSDEDGRFSNDNSTVEGEGETKVLIVATIAWGLRKSSRAIMLALIFLIAMKPGFIHAVYVIFFLIYLLSHNISRKTRQSLILLCEVHFALLYIIQINPISDTLERKGSLSAEVLSQLGLLQHESSWDFLKIALLACFCAIHNHGFEMLFSFSAIVQHTPSRPVGFSILKAGLNKSVLLSVYASSAIKYSHDNPSYGYDSEASSLENVWESLAVLIVMQLYSYERRQSRYNKSDDADVLEFGVLGFIKRCGVDRLQCFLDKSTLIFPFFWVSVYLNLDLGLEFGLRGKVLVIAACTLQYNVFRWLEKMPSTILNKGKWEEPCPLFVSAEDANINSSIPSEENKPSTDSEALSVKREGLGAIHGHFSPQVYRNPLILCPLEQEVLRVVAVTSTHLGTFGAAPRRVISGTRNGFLP